MISFHASLPECPAAKTTVSAEFQHSTKKRKWEEPHSEEQLYFKEKSNDKDDDHRNHTFDVELNLDTPLPSEWQQCLDIQSGQIHFFNTRTYVRTSRDPRRSTASPDASSATPSATGTGLDIDLELNLTCESLRKNSYTAASVIDKKQNSITLGSGREEDDQVLGFTRCPSWLSFDQSEQQEMIATVCMRCHMLVMLCKSSPSCPNCKFMHPQDQNSPTLAKNNKRCSLLC